MKKSLLLTTATFAMLSIQNAFAINLTFQFGVNSSGTSMYACNAGIRHADSPGICVDTNTGSSCTPTSINVSSCVCTSDGTAGSWERDYLRTKSADWTDRNTPLGTTTDSDTQAKNSASSFNALYADDATAFAKQITEMTLNLGSEVYGAEYFVDICYRGTQVAQSNNGNNYSLAGKVTVTNLRANEAGAPNYQLISDLHGKAEIKCFMDQAANTTDTVPGLASPNYTKNSGGPYTSMTTSASQLSMLTDATMSSGSGAKIPRFCVARYYFKENATTERKWKLQQARAAVFTEISDKNNL